MKKSLHEMSVQELKNLMSEIERELTSRETQRTTCVWGIAMKTSKEEPKKETWEGETYIS